MHSQIADLFMKVIQMRANIKLFDLMACFHYILNPPRTMSRRNCKKEHMITLKDGYH